MKLTEPQDIKLRKYLMETMRYRETYQEVYDHILSALAHQEQPENFSDTINRIIRDDFGGHKQLARMEETARKASVKQGVNKYLGYFGVYFTWPKLVSTLSCAIVTYYFSRYIIFPPMFLEGLLALVIFFPRVLALMRYYKAGYVFGDTKRSVRDDIFGRIAYVPVRIFVLGNLLIIIKGQQIWQSFSPVIITAFFVLSGIYVLSFLKLYKDEFKMSVMV